MSAFGSNRRFSLPRQATSDPQVYSRKNKQCQKRRSHQAADHDRRQRPLHFRTRSMGKRHRHKTKTCHKRGHQHWSQPGLRPFLDGFDERPLAIPQLRDIRQQHDAVQNRNTEQSAINPTPAEMLKGMPRSASAKTPPVAASGMLRKISTAGSSAWKLK